MNVSHSIILHRLLNKGERRMIKLLKHVCTCVRLFSDEISLIWRGTKLSDGIWVSSIQLKSFKNDYSNYCYMMFVRMFLSVENFYFSDQYCTLHIFFFCKLNLHFFLLLPYISVVVTALTYTSISFISVRYG